MKNPLAETFRAVRTKRGQNEDVFVWPSLEWCLLYTHEELTELARVVQRVNAPDHARNSDDTSLTTDERLHLEYGQVLMMHITTGLVLGIDPDRALALALDKIDKTATRKRGEQYRIDS
jgi:NTP pyrophosphatase (non-canonical NTP hydrolase)